MGERPNAALTNLMGDWRKINAAVLNLLFLDE